MSLKYINCIFFVIGLSNNRVMTRKHLFMIMQQQDSYTFGEKLDFLENYLLQQDIFSEEDTNKIKHDFSRFKSQIKRRWSVARRSEEYFIKKNAEWLEGTYTIPMPKETRAGRPSKPFIESSERSKRRKTKELCESTDMNLLTYATMSKLGKSGKRDASAVLKDILRSPKRATKYKKAYSKKKRTFKNKLKS